MIKTIFNLQKNFKINSYAYTVLTDVSSDKRRAQEDSIVLKLQTLTPSFLNVVDTTLGTNSCKI